MKRERHLRQAQRPAVYLVLVVLAFTAAAVGAQALWRAESAGAPLIERR